MIKYSNGRIFLYLTYLLRGLLLIGLVAQLWQGKYLAALATLGIVLLTFSSRLLTPALQVKVPIEFEFLTVVFIYLSLFLGEIRGFYEVFWWWDLMLHTLSGFVAGILGFVLVYILNESERIDMNIKPGLVAFFAFLFALGMGTLWELFEYAMDTYFGFNMTKTGLDDTMEDLFVAAVGGFCMALLGYHYLQEPRGISFFKVFINRFIRRNSHKDREPL